MDDDRDLRVALTSAVDEVEPTDRLPRIRQETRRAGRRRRTWYATGGSLLATAAAVIVTVAITRPDATTVADPATQPSDATSVPAAVRLPIYYVGPGPSGPAAPDAVLYRSLETGTSALELLMRTPSDPDYRTLWPQGSLVSYSAESDYISVLLGAGAPLDNELAYQQLLFTLQTIEDSEAPVMYVNVPYGGAADLTFERADDLDVLSHMSITQPTEGATYQKSSGPFTASGWGNSFEAAGGCFLRGADGFEAGPYPIQMDGWMERRLFPWELSVDLSDVSPGSYTFTCVTDDPSGGADGRGTDTDTRTVIVE